MDIYKHYAGLTPEFIEALSNINKYILSLAPDLSVKQEGNIMMYGIQNKVRMRPIVARIELPRPGSLSIQVYVDGSVSDPSRIFSKELSINKRKWRLLSLQVPFKTESVDTIEYIKQQLKESFEHITDRHATAIESPLLLAGELPAVNSEENIESDDDDEVEVIHEDRSKIRWDDKHWSIGELYRLFKDGDIDLQPDYQRGFVWKPSTQKRFLESILMRLPIPVVYVAETLDEKYEVIDGQQRITTIINFMDGKINLSNLKVLNELDGKFYKDLDGNWKRVFQRYQISARALQSSCPPDLKFDMFERLNTGSAKLNNQELRNCICRGSLNKLLHHLAERDDFLRLMGWSKPNERMAGEELILRFFVFYYTNIQSIKNYGNALTNYMRDNSDLTSERAEEHNKIFKLALHNCRTVFGETPFRMWRKPFGNGDNNGYWESKGSGVVFEIMMTGLANYSKEVITKYSNPIKEEFVHLMSNDMQLYESIKLGTNTPDKMIYRNSIWRESLRKLIGAQPSNPRIYSSALKEQLYTTNPYCAICNQKIMTIDDAAIDHVTHYWRGGQTIPSNARLTHRYCNSKRGGRWDDDKIDAE